MKRTLLAVACWLACAVAWGGLATDKAEYNPGDIAVLTVELEGLPEGAVLKGAAKPRITTDAANHTLLVGPGTQIYHLAGTGGTYTVTLLAMWGLPHPEVEGAWLDFGLVDYETVVTFTGGVDPPDPPDPPPGKAWGLILEETSNSSPKWARQRVSLRTEFDKLNKRLLILDESNLSPSLQKYATAVHEANLQLPVLVVVAEDGSVVSVKECPDTVDGVKKELGL